VKDAIMAELTIDEQIAETEAKLAKLRALAKTSRQIRRRVSDKLNNRRIDAIIKNGRDGFYGDGRNLYLRLRDGNASWIVRKNRKDYGLGTYPREVALAEARIARDKLIEAIKEGRDPIAERRNREQAGKVASAKRMTFKQAAEAYVAAHEVEWKNAKHRIAWLQSLTDYTFPVFGAIDCALVDDQLVVKALKPHWLDKLKTMRDLRGRIEKVLDYAASVGARPKDQLNPARWKGHLEHQLAKPTKIAKVEHMKAMPYRDVPGLWTKLVADGSLGALALRLLILTGTRSNEVLEAPWSEFENPDERVWVIPAERMKGRIVHRVPLSDPALELRDALQRLRQGPFLFTSMQQRKDRLAKPVSPMLMRRTLAKLGHGEMTVHGFRSSFRDWCAEQTRFPREVCELALAHRKHNQVEAAYWRSDMLDRRRVDGGMGAPRHRRGACRGRALPRSAAVGVI
jgi:integrase